MEMNVAHRVVREKRRVMVVSSCLLSEGKLEKIRGVFEGYALLSVCPEKHHVNQIGFKLFGMLARVPIEELSVLTTDGSMHCVQLHYLVEELAKGFSFRRRHFVYEKGEIVEIDPEAIRVSRYLSRVSKMLALLSSHGRGR